MKIQLIILLYLSASFAHWTKTKKSSTKCVSKLPPKSNSGCCGIDVTINNRIVGGEETALRQYPWLAHLEFTDKNTGGIDSSMYCGASLISSRYAITAAHCVTDNGDLEETAVRFGDYNRTNPGRDCVKIGGRLDCISSISIPIEKVTVHEDYDSGSFDNDIALIKLKKPVPYADHIRPICLPAEDFTLNAPGDLKLTTAGWGAYAQLWYNGSYTNWDSNVKQHASLPYWPNEICRLVDNSVTPSKICAGGDIGDACTGDSGGPLMYNRDGVYELVGVVSNGLDTPCGQKGTPGVYIKVFDYKEWIGMHL